jgi:hypothetical protein
MQANIQVDIFLPSSYEDGTVCRPFYPSDAAQHPVVHYRSAAHSVLELGCEQNGR